MLKILDKITVLQFLKLLVLVYLGNLILNSSFKIYELSKYDCNRILKDIQKKHPKSKKTLQNFTIVKESIYVEDKDQILTIEIKNNQLVKKEVKYHEYLLVISPIIFVFILMYLLNFGLNLSVKEFIFNKLNYHTNFITWLIGFCTLATSFFIHYFTIGYNFEFNFFSKKEQFSFVNEYTTIEFLNKSNLNDYKKIK